MNYSIIAACGLILTVFSAQADRFADVQIQETALGSNIYMLSGAGGNMATFVAGDEVLLIDSQYAELAEKIRSKVLQLSEGKPLSRLINTHVHGDHVGSNAALSAGVDIIAIKMYWSAYSRMALFLQLVCQPQLLSNSFACV